MNDLHRKQSQQSKFVKTQIKQTSDKNDAYKGTTLIERQTTLSLAVAIMNFFFCLPFKDS
jgi:hypothetical protein